jgi:hypothetical protein
MDPSHLPRWGAAATAFAAASTVETGRNCSCSTLAKMSRLMSLGSSQRPGHGCRNYTGIES